MTTITIIKTMHTPFMHMLPIFLSTLITGFYGSYKWIWWFSAKLTKSFYFIWVC